MGDHRRRGSRNSSSLVRPCSPGYRGAGKLCQKELKFQRPPRAAAFRLAIVSKWAGQGPLISPFWAAQDHSALSALPPCPEHGNNHARETENPGQHASRTAKHLGDGSSRSRDPQSWPSLPFARVRAAIDSALGKPSGGVDTRRAPLPPSTSCRPERERKDGHPWPVLQPVSGEEIGASRADASRAMHISPTRGQQRNRKKGMSEGAPAARQSTKL